MKNRYPILGLLAFLFCTINTFATSNLMCDISSFTADYVPNSCEGEIITIEFDFVATDFGTNGFTVSANGNFSSFNIGDPYMIYMITLCDADVELVITDNDDPNCSETIVLEPACCDCDITDPILGASVCSGGLFDIEVEFFAQEGTCVNYDWYLTIEGVDYDLDYNNSSGMFEATNIQAIGDVLTVLLCNESPLNECYTFLLDNPCFFTTDCMINAITAFTDTTTCDGEIIDVIFDIDAMDFGLNGFSVSDGTVTEFFDLNDDFSFTTISTCDEDIELTFTDLDDSDCFEIITITPDCCECIVDDILVNPTACTNGTFDVYIDMFVESGSCISYDWFITIEGSDYDLIWNGSSLVASDIVAMDSLITASICTLAPSGECFDITFENPCFVSVTDCEITSFTADYVPNSCQGEIIEIEFDFNATDFGVNGFTVSAGGDTTSYNVGDNYFLIMISLCTDDIEVTITDNDDPDCTATVILGPACCDCEISDPVIETSDCDNGTFDVFIDFFDNQGTCVNYNWFLTVDEQDYNLIWNGATNQYEAFDVNSSPGDSLVTILLCNESPLQECFTYTIENPCFDSSSNADCEITSFTADYVPNSCEGEIIQIEFDFVATDFGANGFTIEANGDVTSFNLGDTYVIYMITLCTDDIAVTITDNDDPDCTETVILNPACCDCEISDPVLETTACDNGVFDLHVEFDVLEGTCINYDWFVTIEGVDYILDYNSTGFYEATDISAMDSLVTILLCNDGPLNECYTYTIENPCFDSSSNADCEITSFTADYVANSCEGEIIQIEFDFVATDFGANGFTIEANGDVTSFNLGDTYVIYMITLCTDDIAVTITDNDDPDCTETVILNPACCDCEISDPIITTSDCEEDLFDIYIEFFDNEGTCVNYDWFLTIDGQDYDLDWNNNNQQFEAFEITATDSLVTLSLCNESPLAECFTSLIENPCFESIDSFSSLQSVYANQLIVNHDLSGNINVENLMELDLDISLWNINGTLISRRRIAPRQNNVINHVGLPNGIYLLRCKNEHGERWVEKIIVMR